MQEKGNFRPSIWIDVVVEQDRDNLNYLELISPKFILSCTHLLTWCVLYYRLYN